MAFVHISSDPTAHRFLHADFASALRAALRHDSSESLGLAAPSFGGMACAYIHCRYRIRSRNSSSTAPSHGVAEACSWCCMCGPGMCRLCA